MKHIAYFFIGLAAGVIEVAMTVGKIYAYPFVQISKYGKEWLDERHKNG